MSDDAAIRKRICAHMNKDHSAHLSLYSQHYLHYPPHTPTTCLDISLDALTLSTGIIPLTPPMRSLSDARSRLKLMVLDAQDSLPDHPTPYPLTYLSRPDPASAAVIAAFALFTAILVTGEKSLLPGAWVERYIFAGRGGGLVDWMRVWRWELLVGVWGLHAVETVGLLLPLLRRAGTTGGVWWGWVACGMLEGYGAVRRVRAEMERVRRRVRGEEGEGVKRE